MMTMPEGNCWKEMLQSSFGFESLLCKLKQCHHPVSLTWLLQGNCLKCSIEVGRSEMNLLAQHSHSSVTTALDLPPPPQYNKENEPPKGRRRDRELFTSLSSCLKQHLHFSCIVHFTTALAQMNHYTVYFRHCSKSIFPCYIWDVEIDDSGGKITIKMCNNHFIYVSGLRLRE